MPNVFPTLSSGSMTVHGALGAGAMAQYPSTIVQSYATGIVQFVDDSEQRWTSRIVLFGATLEFRGLNGYDLSLIRNFWAQMKGGYVDSALVNTFTITIGGNTYNFCAFDGDEFEEECERAEQYSLQLKIRQVRPN